MSNHQLTRRNELIPEVFDLMSPLNLLRSTFSGEMMKIEECREGSDYCVRAELPGMDPKNIDINCEEGVLTISAHREEHDFDGHQGAYRSEFRYGSISRTLPLPRDVQVDDCKASYKNGVLELRMPCSERGLKSKKIEVQSS